MNRDELVEYFFHRIMSWDMSKKFPEDLRKEYLKSMWEFAEEKADRFINYFGME